MDMMMAVNMMMTQIRIVAHDVRGRRAVTPLTVTT